MEITEQAKYIDLFLKSIYERSVPTSLAMGIENKQLPSQENREKFIALEWILEELELVILVSGRTNSTLGGQCEYRISPAGSNLVRTKTSSLELLKNQAKNVRWGDSIFATEEAWDRYEDRLLEKRVNQASEFLDILVSENVISLDRETLGKYFKQWFKENHDFDLQFKNGDFAMEDGDLQMLPDVEKEHISDFLKSYKQKSVEFINFLREKGHQINNKSENNIVNNQGNVILVQNSHGINASISPSPDNNVKLVIASFIVDIVAAGAGVWSLIYSILK